MLAPTPVSTLVHSSTLVTAGVYLLFRFLPTSSSFLVNVGIFTTLIAGLAAALECDTKKIIALSTLSQLGLIITSLGFGARSLCFAHLNTHAAFKALLFLAIGTYIHSIYGSQEARSVVILQFSSPFILVTLVTASLSMCGLLFLSGWVSKEAILESGFNNVVSVFSLVLFYVGIGLTLAYRLRLVAIILRSSYSSTASSPTLRSPLLVKVPSFWLLLLTIIEGFTFNQKIFAGPYFLRMEDKFVIFGVLCVSALARLRFRVVSAPSHSPFFLLGLTTSFLRNITVQGTNVFSTEVSAFQGGGLACLPSLLNSIRPGTHFFAKLTVFLSLSFVLL